jgi:hypothetical protein
MTQADLEASIADYIIDEKPLPQQASLTPSSSFNPKTDCEVLRKAMKGIGEWSLHGC